MKGRPFRQLTCFTAGAFTGAPFCVAPSCLCMLEDLEMTNPFYLSAAWQHLRDEVIAADHYECQICKAHGRYSRAVIVHHINHVDEHPELALCKTYVDSTGKEQRNLISVCRRCHETVCHPERMGKHRYKPPITREQWD